MSQSDTIYALSSGQPPCAIAVLRISGSRASTALHALTGVLHVPRKASLRKINHPETGELLDQALVLWFEGPSTVTGEDLVELHLHGGRAVVRAVEQALSILPSMRPAIAGEFTRRAFENGRMDLAQADGLADLLSAESELQRRVAMSLASGLFSKKIESWRRKILEISAQVEAELDFSDEEDVAPERRETITFAAIDAHREISELLLQPPAEKLRDGVKVVLAGPPNAGKSTLLNALVQRDAAIVSDIAGTTRDLIDVPISLDGIPFMFTDTAGLRTDHIDEIEKIGIARARDAIDDGDVILWLGPEGEGPEHRQLWEIEAQIDKVPIYRKAKPDVRVSAKTGENMGVLVEMLAAISRDILPAPDSFAVNARQRGHLSDAALALSNVSIRDDMLMIAEELRLARLALDGLLGNTHTEDMLDTLFGRFCIGK